jgi:uncharacterized membrane protein
VTISGTLTPTQSSPGIPAGASIVLSYSLGGGAYNSFLTTASGTGGSYSSTWYPPYLGTYSIRATWAGDQNYADSTSSTVTLTVTGTLTSQPQLLVSGASTVARGATATFEVLLTNTGPSTLTTTIYVEIIGPNGYYCFDWLQASVPSSSSSRYQFNWQVPSNAGTGNYMITVGLMSPRTASIGQTQITVT